MFLVKGHLNPASPLVTKVEQIRMQDFSEDLSGLHQPWPRAIEIVVAIDDIDRPALYG
jgi:hypothetical protein